MALLVGGPKDGEIVEMRSPQDTLVIAVPNSRDEYPARAVYHKVKLNLFGLKFPVWVYAPLEADAYRYARERAVARHLLTPLAFALDAEVYG